MFSQFPLSPLLRVQSTSVTWPNVCTMQFRINVVRLDLSGNRMRRKSGYRIADMLLLNKTIADLNVSNNCLDSDVRPALDALFVFV